MSNSVTITVSDVARRVVFWLGGMNSQQVILLHVRFMLNLSVSVAPQNGEVIHHSRPPPPVHNHNAPPPSTVIQRPYRHHDHHHPPRHPQHGTVSNRLPHPDQVTTKMTKKYCPRLREFRVPSAASWLADKHFLMFLRMSTESTDSILALRP